MWNSGSERKETLLGKLGKYEPTTVVMKENTFVLGKYTMEYLGVMGNHMCSLLSSGSEKD